jgi:hypothetical protein
MTADELLILACLVRLCTWFLQTSGMFPMLGELVLAVPMRRQSRDWLQEKAREFWTCDLCLGFWVSLVLLAAWRYGSEKLLPFESITIVWLALPATAGGLSLAVHLLRLGWQSKWATIIMGGSEFAISDKPIGEDWPTIDGAE